jgi:hypothetical protein
MMPDQTSEKAEVKMYSDFKSPYALAFDPAWRSGSVSMCEYDGFRFSCDSKARASAASIPSTRSNTPTWMLGAGRNRAVSGI